MEKFSISIPKINSIALGQGLPFDKNLSTQSLGFISKIEELSIILMNEGFATFSILQIFNLIKGFFEDGLRFFKTMFVPINKVNSNFRQSSKQGGIRIFSIISTVFNNSFNLRVKFPYGPVSERRFLAFSIMKDFNK